MLLQLSIRNYAIIDQLDWLPGRQLNIITGETGAGKSIILGALSLILGERADTAVLINKEAKCVVEAVFEVGDNQPLLQALKEADLDEEAQCVIRREINSSGKSRAFVNDTPVTLATLQRLTALLVDLHQQFDNLAIEEDAFQMSVLDALADNASIKAQYQTVYQQYQATAAQLARQTELQEQFQKEADYKQFLFEELEQANWQPNEIEDAEMQLKQLGAAEKIISTLKQTRFLLDDGDQPLTVELKRQAQQMNAISDVLHEGQALHERLISLYAEAKDIAAELAHLEEKITLDPHKMLALEERLSLGVKLLKKHAVQSTDELITIFHNLSSALQASNDLHEQIAALVLQKDNLYKELLGLADQLSASRKQVLDTTEAKINTMLADVGMPNARFKIEMLPLGKPNVWGIDHVSFLLDANKSNHFQPVAKAASGGEMSRIALCIKSLIARAVHLPTLIFDEVDTGISGEAALKVAALLQNLAQFHQVICITHQPQVAAKGNTHFYVYKAEDEQGKIYTKVRTLSLDEKILAIAKMIGGEQPSEAAMNNARELVHH